MLDITKILERINLDPQQNYEATLETLRLLVKHYILYVPYENLDLALQKKFSAQIEHIYEKIVCECRGGICYESNTLFAYLLERLGYEVKMILAKVEDSAYIGYNYPHLALLVSLEDDEYLVDVAYGQNVREPMPLHDKSFRAFAENAEYKIEQNDKGYTLFSQYKEKGWLPKYSFTTQARAVAEFASIFDEVDETHLSTEDMLLVTKALENGRVTLTCDTVSIKKEDEKTSWDVCQQNRQKVLKEYFDITL